MEKTINEIRENKTGLEKLIEELLTDFEKTHDVSISAINYFQTPLLEDSDVRKKHLHNFILYLSI